MSQECRLRRIAYATMACVLAGCASQEPGLVLEDVEFRAAVGSGQPSLHATADGRVMLSWLEARGEGRHALRWSVRSAAGWSAANTVKESDRFFVNWADFPSLVELADGTLLVHWLESVEGDRYAYHVKLAMSGDAGAHWQADFAPHRDDSPTEHGFVSLLPLHEGGAALIWLDGRALSSEGAVTGHERIDRGDMSLRATSIDAKGALGPEELVDDRTCECCQTSLAQTANGWVAAYRDRSAEEIRDIVVARRVVGEWSEPRRVAEDGWHYPGCPVNGPQLAARDDSVVIAWFTAPEQQAAVKLAFSFDGGATFGAPIRVDGGDPLGRVDVEWSASGAAVVVWLERGAEAAEIRALRVEPGGRLGSPLRIAETTEARASGFPRLTSVGDYAFVAWTALGEDGGVRVARVRVAE